MTAYAVGRFRDLCISDDIRRYLEAINETLAPYSGCFLIHGGTPEVLEGEWDEALVVIGFPSLAQARDWYRSADYQQILPLRRGNGTSKVALIEDAGPGHLATDILAADAKG